MRPGGTKPLYFFLFWYFFSILGYFLHTVFQLRVRLIVETIKRQTWERGLRMAVWLQAKVRVCGVGLRRWPRLWCTAPLRRYLRRHVNAEPLLILFYSNSLQEQYIGLPGLAVHWEAEIVFWSDMNLGHIMYSRLDGRYHAFLITGLVKPKSIAVDPVEGYFNF